MELSALHKLWERGDESWFRKYPSRTTHIRNAYQQECDGEFWSLGSHEKKRRRILLWRPPPGHSSYKQEKCPLLKIPFLAFADETIEDRDDILLPIIAEVMRDARERHKF